MNIGIIGAGNVGSALGRASVEAGYAVAISARDPKHAADVAAEVGARGAADNRDAVREAEIVILAVPYDAVSDIAAELGDVLAGKAVVDVTNRFTPEDLGGESNAEEIQAMLPGAGVVKAFNTILASHQTDPEADGVRLDGFVAGDDARAKQIVLDLVQSLGFRPIDAGGLAMSRALEGMGTLNIGLNMNNGWPWLTGWKLLGPTT
jgi:8-hydroxy-5-deazaflavin:NADPH oxidoreductase